MKLSEYARAVSPIKLSNFQIELLDECENAIRNNTPTIIVSGMRSGKTWMLNTINEWKTSYYEVNNMAEISEQIKDKAEVISEYIKDGKHVELCENKDGLRIIAMDRKVVK